MTGLTVALSAARSSLLVNQQGISVVSRNIANLGVDGYIKAELDQRGSLLGGVEVNAVRLAADRYLSAAAYAASARASGAGVRNDLLTRANEALGDPNRSGSVFTALDGALGSFAALASDPASSLRRDDAVIAASNLFSTYRTAQGDFEAVRTETDDRLRAAVDDVNRLLRDLAVANESVVRARADNGDSTAAESARAGLLDQLSTYVEIRVIDRRNGSIELRTEAGGLLLSTSPAQLELDPGASTAGSIARVDIVTPQGGREPLESLGGDGILNGLLTVRNRDLPAFAESLSTLASAAADALNAVHNQSAAAPPPTVLQGRATGLLATDPANFTGVLRVASVQQSSGEVLASAEITLDGLSVQDVVDAINAAAVGVTASFADGALRLEAVPGQGVALGEGDPATDRAGRGFSHFFGLNDLITSERPYFYDAGFTGTEAAPATGEINFALVDAAGRRQTRSFDFATLAPGATLADAAAAIDAALQPFADATFADGRLQVSPGAGVRLEAASDTTSRGGLPLSSLFGFSADARLARVGGLDVRADIRADSDTLALARVELLPGARLERGDPSGANALAGAGDLVRAVPAGGLFSEQTISLSRLSSTFGGLVGQEANRAADEQAFASSVASVARERRSEVESVNLDSELVLLQQYQQAYSAAARVVQVVQDLFDQLLRIGAN